MTIRGFVFIPTDKIEKNSLPSNAFYIGTVSSYSSTDGSSTYKTYAILEKDQKIESLTEKDASRVCRKIQKCLDNLPSFCEKPECWGENGFRFRRIRIPNTFETANFSKSGADVFKSCQKILNPSLSTNTKISSAPTRPLSFQKVPVQKMTSSQDYQALIDSLLSHLKKYPNNGSLEQIQALIKEALIKEKNEGIVDQSGSSILHYLITSGIQPLIECALSEYRSQNGDLDPSTPDAYLGSFLNFLCNRGAQEKVSKKFKDLDILIPNQAWNAFNLPRDKIASNLLLAGANINVQDDAGTTPLHQAIYFRDVEFVKFLVENKARRDLKNQGKLTPFEETIKSLKICPDWPKINILRSLLKDSSEDINHPLEGDTLLHIVAKDLAKYPSFYAKFIIELIEGNANATLKNSENVTAFEMIFRHFKTEKTANNQLSKFCEPLYKMLLHNPLIDIDTSIDGQTLLQVSVEKANASLASFLISRKANIQTKNAQGYSLFYENLQRAKTVCQDAQRGDKALEELLERRVKIAICFIEADYVIDKKTDSPLLAEMNRQVHPCWECLIQCLEKKGLISAQKIS